MWHIARRHTFLIDQSQTPVTFHILQRVQGPVSLTLFIWLVFLLSELVGPWQDVEGTGCGGDGDVAAEEKVLLLRPERRLQRPRPAQLALCAGIHIPNNSLWFS